MKEAGNTQNIQITGSSGVSLSDIRQEIRGSPNERETREEARPLAITVLFVAANPPATERLQLDREFKAIGEALRCAGPASGFVLEQSWAASPRDLQDSLLRHRPEIVHWSGHGDRRGVLLLEADPAAPELGRYQQVETASTEQVLHGLAGLFSLVRGKTRCAVLSFCHSEKAARTIAEHVDCVVGMSAALEDTAALQFSWAFYNALTLGYSVKAAFEAASAQLALYGKDVVARLYATRSDPAEVRFTSPARESESG